MNHAYFGIDLEEVRELVRMRKYSEAIEICDEIMQTISASDTDSMVDMEIYSSAAQLRKEIKRKEKIWTFFGLLNVFNRKGR